MGQKVLNYGRSYAEKKAKDELVHGTPGCEGKNINTKMKTIKKKKMERLSGSHPISLPHSGELFLIGSSRRKRKTFVSAGAGQSSQAKDYAITQGWGLRRTSSLSVARNQGGFWVA